MSVRDFQNHPCPVCKSDTLHVAMVCQVCGHKQIHPHEQFESREAKGAMPKRRYPISNMCLRGQGMRAVDVVIRRGSKAILRDSRAK